MPYVLAVASHKGGTGRTTAALALAWTWGAAGRRVLFVDADPVAAAGLVCRGADGVCRWPNVATAAGLPDRFPADADVAVIDCPALTEPAAQAVLVRCDGVLLTSLPDPLSLRTVPVAAAAVRQARRTRPGLEVLGLMIPVLNPADPLAADMMARLRAGHADLLIEPPVPARPEAADWPLSPGSDLPAGPVREAYARVAAALEAIIGAAAARR
jgi:cellulose biosynthesis protein BcsQ